MIKHRCKTNNNKTDNNNNNKRGGSLKKPLSSLLSFLALFCVATYRVFLSGNMAMGGACRFYPSCSEYALLAYKKFPFLKASQLVLKRLIACQPFGPKFRDESWLFKP